MMVLNYGFEGSVKSAVSNETKLAVLSGTIIQPLMT